MIRHISVILTCLLLNFYPDGTSGDTHEVVLSIENISEGSGYLMVAVYNRETDFLSDRVFYTEKIKVAGERSQSIKLKLPKGNYAIAVYQDLNGDNMLNKSFIGIPTEPYGFSGKDYLRLRSPSWNDIFLRIEKDERIRISID